MGKKCDGGKCDQSGCSMPLCDGGKCNQSGAFNPKCGGGKCDQTGANGASCDGGHCIQVDCFNCKCPAGGCKTTTTTTTSTTEQDTTEKAEPEEDKTSNADETSTSGALTEDIAELSDQLKADQSDAAADTVSLFSNSGTAAATVRAARVAGISGMLALLGSALVAISRRRGSAEAALTNPLLTDEAIHVIA